MPKIMHSKAPSSDSAKSPSEIQRKILINYIRAGYLGALSGVARRTTGRWRSQIHRQGTQIQPGPLERGGRARGYRDARRPQPPMIPWKPCWPSAK